MLKYDLDYLLNHNIIFCDEEWNEDGEYWWVYFTDVDCTKRIDDIDKFIEDYNKCGETDAT